MSDTLKHHCGWMTIQGPCIQDKSPGKKHCYYHCKCESGLIKEGEIFIIMEEIRKNATSGRSWNSVKRILSDEF